jgi:hypothetical protein
VDRTAYCEVVFHGSDFKVVGNFVTLEGKVTVDAVPILFMNEWHK